MKWLYNLDEKEKEKEKVELPFEQRTCWHDWKETTLIVSKVYDCTKCSLKKEDYDKWMKTK